MKFSDIQGGLLKGRVFHWDFKGEDILVWDWSMIEFSWIHSINDYKPKSTSVKFNSLELDTEVVGLV